MNRLAGLPDLDAEVFKQRIADFMYDLSQYVGRRYPDGSVDYQYGVFGRVQNH
jgi:hypothetical protein